MLEIMKFIDLKQRVAMLEGRSSEDAWDDAQKWKCEAQEIVAEALVGHDKKDILKQIKCLFNAGFMASANMGRLITETDQEVENRFLRDIDSAKKLMDECIKIFQCPSCISQKEVTPSNESQVKKEEKCAIEDIAWSNRKTFSKEASVALDMAMDAADCRFNGTKYW